MRRDPFPLVLKEGSVALAADADGGVRAQAHGLFAHDARWLRRYHWSWPDGLSELRLDGRGPGVLRQRLSRIEGGVGRMGVSSPRETLGVERSLRLREDGFHDRLELTAPAGVEARLHAELRLDARVEDVFEVRGFAETVARDRTASLGGTVLTVESRAPDGVVDRLELWVDADPEVDVTLREDGLALAARIPAGGRRIVEVRVRIERRAAAKPEPRGLPARLADVVPGEPLQLPDAEAWRRRVAPDSMLAGLDARDAELAAHAAADLRALLLPTPVGPVPAAGVPWYVAPFGRDALIACLLVPEAEEAARGSLRLLAALQGRRHDPWRAEAPGKIPHEMRVGAVTRLGRTPHGPHYGTVDATPLWVVLLRRRVEAGDAELLHELEPALRAALGWMRDAGAGDPDGLLRFRSGEGGYQVQSWKDAGDSMTHADGTLATGELAVVEVQGYAEAAWRDAAELLGRLGDDDGAADARRRGRAIRRALARRFFLPGLGPAGCHALALDGDGRPLAVLASDAGHLLWTGSVPGRQATAVAAALTGPSAWSGWGVRTLAEGEARYASLSYHTGSVWPHDTALFGVGLARYGRHADARRVARAVLDLAAASPSGRAPELIAGDARDDGPPVAYPDACKLQAWSAASVLAMARLLANPG